MSLAQRRTDVVGTEFIGPLNANQQSQVALDADPAQRRHIWRHLTFDAFTAQQLKETPDELAIQRHYLKAYKHSTKRRAVQVAVAVLACWFASGIVCGFAALKPVLIAEHVYAELCPADWPVDSKVPCPEQDMRLNLFYITASITLNVSTIFAGYTLDKYGRRMCYVTAAIILALGAILMAFAFAIPEFDGYLAGNMMLGLGGTYLFVASFQLANAFPKYSGVIVALVTGAFDASAAVFLFYRMAYDATNGAFQPEYFFLGFLVVPVFILIAEFTVMPKYAYQDRTQLESRLEKAQDAVAECEDGEVDESRLEAKRNKLVRIETVVGTQEQRERRDAKVSQRQEKSGVWGVLHDLPYSRQMKTAWFILILILTMLQMLRMNYFIATVHAQYRYMLGSEEAADKVNHFFDVALPVAGVISTPFIGFLLNELSVVITLGTLTFFIILVGVLNCLPYLWAGFATVVAFVFFRPLYYSAMSDYATKVFGFATFGRIYGTITCVSGLSNFVQPALDVLTHGPLHNDPKPVNIFFAAAGTVTSLALAMYVYIKSKAWAKQQRDLEETGEEERASLLGGSGGRNGHYGAVRGMTIS